MIYFTEVTQADGKGAEKVIFQFYPRELPEVIPFGFKTKVNHIEYPGGFVTNQIIGVYQDTIEWEGTFYGVYKDEKGAIITAKERAFKIKEFLGRPIRCVFAVPNAEVKSIPGYGEQSNVGSLDKGENSAGIKNGVSYVYIIEEYSMSVSNYTDVNYKIKLTPHQRQEKIKPKDVKVAEVKVNMQAASDAGKRVAGNNPPGGKPSLQGAAQQGNNSSKVADKSLKSRFAKRKIDAGIEKRALNAETPRPFNPRGSIDPSSPAS
jgi:hypothetical protein